MVVHSTAEKIVGSTLLGWTIANQTTATKIALLYYSTASASSLIFGIYYKLLLYYYFKLFYITIIIIEIIITTIITLTSFYNHNNYIPPLISSSSFFLFYLLLLFFFFFGRRRRRRRRSLLQEDITTTTSETAALATLAYFLHAAFTPQSTASSRHTSKFDIKMANNQFTGQMDTGNSRGETLGSSVGSLDEPVSETIMRDLNKIYVKLRVVLCPQTSQEDTLRELRQWDLWGPLLLCLLLSIILSIGAPKGQEMLLFLSVFFIFWVGSAVVTFNAQLLVARFRFPKCLCLRLLHVSSNIGSVLCYLWSNWIWRVVVTSVCLFWSTRASIVFISQMIDEKKNPGSLSRHTFLLGDQLDDFDIWMKDNMARRQTFDYKRLHILLKKILSFKPSSGSYLGDIVICSMIHHN